MEFTLKEFIEKTLCDVCEAVDSARSKHSYIAPKIFTQPSNQEKATVVDFDVAVTVTDAESSSVDGQVKGSFGFNISVVKAEANLGDNEEKANSSSSSKESRVKFSVPVYFQFDEEERTRLIKESNARKRKGTLYA